MKLSITITKPPIFFSSWKIDLGPRIQPHASLWISSHKTLEYWPKKKKTQLPNQRENSYNYSGNSTVFFFFCFRRGTNAEGQEAGMILLLEKAQLIFSPCIGNFKEL